ncbi:F-box/kelch-repeat protein At3g06240-like isoform X1 [Rosa chinensis]|nr:F-box/kelch-repeat protein At3g06240-like isoform X1 [Rosa chinensis]XP_040368125.1 F-box/kelch-repeat protein At3g06240-like isoform X1 [Rosa chinensis]XP_040368126.1 F-box/kelch-repeat protein At3g06240-like isoform X1 [Rosa chinensis]XP_040368127.1 F-box/kelch-repeat protein At3g06240-like isoform X1 [Rosa chinensis]XP_040368129.1 F-box/kelch-repeat protein At3g06240-like isoform X1 [Rosa chinensis]
MESKETQVRENGRASTLQKKGNTVPVESKLLDPNSIPMFGHPALNSPKNCVKFLEFKNGKSGIGEYSLSCWASDIKATCNGLILLDNNLKKGGVIVLNPVTKKVIALPVGTLCNHPHEESYGFAMSDVTGEYKVVHLVLDQLGFACCEIFSLYKKTWRDVNGPSIELVDNGGFGHVPVSAIGALHWPFYRSDYVVSMEVDEEKFHHIELPKSCTTHDRIIEICGCLGFVTHEDMNHIDIWILTSLCGEEWTKNHTITVETTRDMVPLCSLRFKGDIIFHTSDGSFYAYDFQQQQMTEIIGKINRLPWCLPHVNSLVTWDARE